MPQWQFTIGAVIAYNITRRHARVGAFLQDCNETKDSLNCQDLPGMTYELSSCTEMKAFSTATGFDRMERGSPR